MSQLTLCHSGIILLYNNTAVANRAGEKYVVVKSNPLCSLITPQRSVYLPRVGDTGYARSGWGSQLKTPLSKQ